MSSADLADMLLLLLRQTAPHDSSALADMLLLLLLHGV
jgi:hypothetical protein